MKDHYVKLVPNLQEVRKVREIKALWLGIEPTVIMVQQLPIE
jgi:hypothetical protein